MGEQCQPEILPAAKQKTKQETCIHRHAGMTFRQYARIHTDMKNSTLRHRDSSQTLILLRRYFTILAEAVQVGLIR